MNKEYHGYIIKTEDKTVGFGKEFVLYKDGDMIARCNSLKIAEETADWHKEVMNNVR